MNKPLNKYNYYPWQVKDYNDWAEQADKQGDCMLRIEYAQKLEDIYSSENYTDKQHDDNISFLEKVQMDLELVWSFIVRKKSGMCSLVQDYKDYFKLKQ